MCWEGHEIIKLKAPLKVWSTASERMIHFILVCGYEWWWWQYICHQKHDWCSVNKCDYHLQINFCSYSATCRAKMFDPAASVQLFLMRKYKQKHNYTFVREWLQFTFFQNKESIALLTSSCCRINLLSNTSHSFIKLILKRVNFKFFGCRLTYILQPSYWKCNYSNTYSDIFKKGKEIRK